MSKIMLPENFDNETTNQTDFGRIYYAVPSNFYQPESVAELSALLKKFNREKIPVTIRNTGHSVNGQTVTDGVQVSLHKLQKISLDEEHRRITVGAGVHWNDIIQTCLPHDLCPPIFTQNPGQQIRVGGTAAVGGAGIYACKYGGFWNNVYSIKLVTMSGEIITCSLDKDFELLQYSLGGFGRIGVIAEITIQLVESLKDVLVMGLVYHDLDTHLNDIQKAVDTGSYHGVVSEIVVDDHEYILSAKQRPMIMVLIKEYDGTKESAEEIAHATRKLFNEDLTVYFAKQGSELDLALHVNPITKEDAIYFYPTGKDDQMEQYHPWSDYIIPFEKYHDFLEESISVMHKYKVFKYLPHKSMLHGKLDVNVLVTYFGKANTELDYPLALRPNNKDVVISAGMTVLPTVPKEKVVEMMDMIEELTDLTYKYDGKRYMYGIHNLSKEQLMMQYGKEVLSNWQKLKDKHDPHHLLNLGVIEHLD